MEQREQHEQLRILLLSTSKGAEQQQLVQLAQQVVARGLCELAVVLCNSQTVPCTNTADKHICTLNRRLLDGCQVAIVLRSDRLFRQENDEQQWQHMQQAVPCLHLQQSSGPQLRLLCCSGLSRLELQSRMEQDHHQAVTVAAGLLRSDDALQGSETPAGQHPLQVIWPCCPQSGACTLASRSAICHEACACAVCQLLGIGDLCSSAEAPHS